MAQDPAAQRIRNGFEKRFGARNGLNRLYAHTYSLNMACLRTTIAGRSASNTSAGSRWIIHASIHPRACFKRPKLTHDAIVVTRKRDRVIFGSAANAQRWQGFIGAEPPEMIARLIADARSDESAFPTEDRPTLPGSSQV